MSTLEFNKRKDFLCALPFLGLTVGPRGSVTLCCNSTDHPIGQLAQIEDLESFFNGPVFANIRETMINEKILELPHCKWCYSNYKKGFKNEVYNVNHHWLPIYENVFDQDWHTRESGKVSPIRFLEYTCSNTCNQACSTCNSHYSSKWSSLEQSFSSSEISKFNRNPLETTSLTEKDVQKLFKITPGLVQLFIKGGEPWADKNNIKILENVLDTNPHCKISIVSNMQKLIKDALSVIKKFRNHKGEIFLGASIDGIGDEYRWIRSTPFERTIETMAEFHQITGRKISIETCVSAHNFFSLDKIAHYFEDKEYISHINMINPAGLHKYLEYKSLPAEAVIKQKYKYMEDFSRLKESMRKKKKYFQYDLLLVTEDDIKRSDDLESLKLVVDWIGQMNRIRGFNLEDLVPELKTLRRTFEPTKKETFYKKISKNLFSSQLKSFLDQ